MPSEFATKLVAEVYKPDALSASNEAAKRVDTELQDVRSLLEQTMRRVLPDGPCWCVLYLSLAGHTDDCERTREVFRRLEIKG